MMPEILTLRDRLGAMTRERGEIASVALDAAAIERLMQLRRERIALSDRLAALESRVFPAFRTSAHD